MQVKESLHCLELYLVLPTREKHPTPQSVKSLQEAICEKHQAISQTNKQTNKKRSDKDVKYDNSRKLNTLICSDTVLW